MTLWSIRCSWSIACLCCSNYIFIINLTPDFNGLGKDTYKMRQETFKFWDLVHVILRGLKVVLEADFSLREDTHISSWWVSCRTSLVSTMKTNGWNIDNLLYHVSPDKFHLANALKSTSVRHQSNTYWLFVRGIHWWAVDSSHKEQESVGLISCWLWSEGLCWRWCNSMHNEWLK